MRTGYLAGLAALVLLKFAGYGGLWLIIPFTIAAFFIALYLLLSQISCPSCGVPLLSRPAIKSPDQCHNCGRPLNAKQSSKRQTAKKIAARYEDQRAGKISWKPLGTQSANFDSHKLHIDRRGRLSFKPTPGSLMFDGIFLVFGLVFYTISHFIPNFGFWVSLLPLLFVAFGLFLLYRSMMPKRINRNAGLFVLGWSREEAVPLGEIEAVQLLARAVASKGRSYNNYQINLVLPGGERRNVVTYFNRQKAIEAAQRLASALGVKLWDNLEQKN